MTTKAILPWIKLSTNLLDDPSFNIQLSLEHQAIYTKLYLAAGKLDQRGSFVDDTGRELTTKEIAWLIHVDERVLSRALKALLKSGMLSTNGHGPFIKAFKSEQGDLTHAERCEQWRVRQNKSRESRASHEDVTRDTSARVKSQEEDEESRGKSQEEDESSSSKSLMLSGNNADGDDDDLFSTGRKNQIIRSIGIRAKERKKLIGNQNIKPEDLIAEYTRNYARHIEDPEKCKNPGAITGINLYRYEFPSAEWYEEKTWIRHLPRSILVAILPDLVAEQDKAIQESTKVTTRKKKPKSVSIYRAGEYGGHIK